MPDPDSEDFNNDDDTHQWYGHAQDYDADDTAPHHIISSDADRIRIDRHRRARRVRTRIEE